MNSLRGKTFISLGIICLVLLLNACSSLQIAYNQSDLLLKWWIDDYIDISQEQEQLFSKSFPTIVNKHRQEQLPKALVKIRQLNSKLNHPLALSDTQNIVKDIKSISLETMNLFLDDATKLALILDPKQFNYMENAFLKANKKFQNEYLSGSSEDRLNARVEKVIERTESFSGDLKKSQKLLIKNIAKENLIDIEILYQIRLSKQQMILKTLKRISQEQLPPSQTKSILEKLFSEIVWGSTSEQIEIEKKKDLQSAIIISKITEILDAEQLKKTQSKLKNWEVDISKLIEQK